MNKKISIIFLLIFFLISILLSPSTLTKKTFNENGEVLGIFTSVIIIEKDREIDDPMGSSDSEEIKISVGFKLDIGSLFKRLLFNRRIGRLILFGPGYILQLFKQLPNANVNLTLQGCPEWCIASLSNSSLKFEYDNEFVEKEILLRISTNKSVPALKKTDIMIIANYEGHWTIKSALNTLNISILTAYQSQIVWEAKLNHTIPPIINTTIPINITNNGNGETLVDIEIIDPPANWSIIINPNTITIPIDENDNTRLINLVVNPPREFKEETITLKLTPTAIDGEDIYNQHKLGDPITFNINFVNDGSLEEENKIEIDTSILLAIITVIVIIFIIAIILIRKR